ncbi:MAG: TonB-dependent receptor [Vicinamibacterales bacterium]
MLMSITRIVACVLLCALEALSAEPSMRITGTVRDASGGAVRNAEIALLTPALTTVTSARTDAQGGCALDAPSTGNFLLLIRAQAFAEVRRALSVTESKPVPSLVIVLEVGALVEDVTVSASRETVDDLRRASHPVNVITAEEIGSRVKTVVAEAVQEESGVALQRTSPTMAGVFVRGLTGNKVNVFVDGVRYSNGAQRGGVNTFLDLIEPEAIETIEIVRGPSSAQYGSDALGGSIQFFSRPPALGIPGGRSWRGWASANGGTAHRTGGASALIGYMGPKLGVSATVGGRKTGSIRTGGGYDSHAAVTRFLGIKSDQLMDEWLPDTGFEQLGATLRANWVPSANTQFVASYMKSAQDGGERYDQLLGGDGNLISELNDLSLDLFSARFERASVGLFDHLSLTYSLNSQREERVNQGGNGSRTATIGHEPERTTVHGTQLALTRQFSSRHALTIGGDAYFERLTSDAFNVNPMTNAVSVRRPRIPSNARFLQGGVYAQSTFDVVPDHVKLTGSARWGGAHYRAKASDSPVQTPSPLWPDDQLDVSDLTYRAAAVLTPNNTWGFMVSASRGFRAPHMTDLGTLGLTGSGFEVAAPDVEGLTGTVGSTANANAVTTGLAVEQVGPETSMQYEGSVRYRHRHFRSDLTLFVNDVHDNIQKQALILPQGAVGIVLGGSPITSQNANGAVFVAATTIPVLVRANFDDARIWGIEHGAELRFGNVSARSAFTYLRARDVNTDLPPNIEGGTPAPDLWISARWQGDGGRLWVEPYAHVAWEQPHLSTLDLGDRRIGSGRSRSSIQSFFRNGATNRGWVSPGADGAFGTGDDTLILTGETLTQIQDRVLGVGVNSSSLFPSIPGYATFGARFGLRFGPHELVIDASNLNDENYRGLSWGVDAPGRGVSVRYSTRF